MNEGDTIAERSGQADQSKPRLYSCHECDRAFPTPCKLQRHLFTHILIGVAYCDLCDCHIFHDDNLIPHWRNNCKGMESVLSKEERNYLSNPDLKLFVIDYIMEVGEEALKSSIFEKTDKRNRMTCNYCNVTLPPMALRHHIEAHRGVVRVTHTLDVHMGGFACDLCGVLFKSRRFLYQHWRESCFEVLSKLPTSNKPMSDEGLEEIVNEALQSSVVNKLPTNYNEVDENDAARDRNFDDARASTSTGGKHKTEASKLGEDRKQFSDDFPYISAPVKLKVTDWILTKPPYMKCKICDRAFVSRGRLERHLRTFHECWRSRKSCQLCGAGLQNDAQMVLHWRDTCKPMKIELPSEEERHATPAEGLRRFVTSIQEKYIDLREALRHESRSRLNSFLEMYAIPRSTRKASMNGNEAGRNGIDLKTLRKVLPQKLLDAFSRPHISESIGDMRLNRGLVNLTCNFCSRAFCGKAVISRHLLTVHRDLVMCYERLQRKRQCEISESVASFADRDPPKLEPEDVKNAVAISHATVTRDFKLKIAKYEDASCLVRSSLRDCKIIDSVVVKIDKTSPRLAVFYTEQGERVSAGMYATDFNNRIVDIVTEQRLDLENNPHIIPFDRIQWWARESRTNDLLLMRVRGSDHRNSVIMVPEPEWSLIIGDDGHPLKLYKDDPTEMID